MGGVAGLFLSSVCMASGWHYAFRGNPNWGFCRWGLLCRNPRCREHETCCLDFSACPIEEARWILRKWGMSYLHAGSKGDLVPCLAQEVWKKSSWFGLNFTMIFRFLNRNLGVVIRIRTLNSFKITLWICDATVSLKIGSFFTPLGNLTGPTILRILIDWGKEITQWKISHGSSKSIQALSLSPSHPFFTSCTQMAT